MLLLLISFIAGCLTVFAPCVLPLLPVIVGSSLASKTKDSLRPYIISASLALSIILFTLLLKVSTLLINLPPDALNYFSGGIVIGLGITTLFPSLWEGLMIKLNLQAKSQVFLGKSENVNKKYLGPVLIGIALGPVFASCSPTYAFILASVLPHSLASGLIYLSIYAIGVVLTLLAVSIGGKKIISKYSWAVDTRSAFRRSLGVLFIIIGLIIFSGRLTAVETWVANRTPFDETKVERVLLAKQQKPTLDHSISTAITNTSVLNVQPTKAPQLVGVSNWINTSPLQISKLKGKVVLVDFWTYSCINCIRSIPFVENWYKTYQNDGLVVIGVSTPEFAFEHNPQNVANAVKRLGISYPVVLDNNYDTWNAYNNNSWPADYLIDKQGNIRYVSLGEGQYDVTEKAIKQLLGINNKTLISSSSYTVPISQNQTPETYLGPYREDAYVGNTSLSDGVNDYSAVPQSDLQSGQWNISGSWNISDKYITSNDSNADISINVNAKDVYLVAGSNSPINATVTLPNNVKGEFGPDDPGGNLVINGYRLYHIASFSSQQNAVISINLNSGISLYTFTFGS